MRKHAASLIILLSEPLDGGSEFIYTFVPHMWTLKLIKWKSIIQPNHMVSIRFKCLIYIYTSWVPCESLVSSCIREMCDQAKTWSNQIHQKWKGGNHHSVYAKMKEILARLKMTQLLFGVILFNHDRKFTLSKCTSLICWWKRNTGFVKVLTFHGKFQ